MGKAKLYTMVVVAVPMWQSGLAVSLHGKKGCMEMEVQQQLVHATRLHCFALVSET